MLKDVTYLFSKRWVKTGGRGGRGAKSREEGIGRREEKGRERKAGNRAKGKGNRDPERRGVGVPLRG
jgi:hypothetical protein